MRTSAASVGTKTTSLSSGIGGDRFERAQVLQAEPRGQGVRHTRIGDIGVGVGDEVGEARSDHPMDQGALRVIGRHPVHPGQ